MLDKLKKNLKDGALTIPESMESSRSDIESICRKVVGSLNIKNNDDKPTVSTRKAHNWMQISKNFGIVSNLKQNTTFTLTVMNSLRSASEIWTRN